MIQEYIRHNNNINSGFAREPRTSTNIVYTRTRIQRNKNNKITLTDNTHNKHNNNNHHNHNNNNKHNKNKNNNRHYQRPKTIQQAITTSNYCELIISCSETLYFRSKIWKLLFGSSLVLVRFPSELQHVDGWGRCLLVMRFSDCIQRLLPFVSPPPLTYI